MLGAALSWLGLAEIMITIAQMGIIITSTITATPTAW